MSHVSLSVTSLFQCHTSLSVSQSLSVSHVSLSVTSLFECHKFLSLGPFSAHTFLQFAHPLLQQHHILPPNLELPRLFLMLFFLLDLSSTIRRRRAAAAVGSKSQEMAVVASRPATSPGIMRYSTECLLVSGGQSLAALRAYLQ